MVEGGVRGGAPESLHQRPGGPAGIGRLFPVLQRDQTQTPGYRTPAEVFYEEKEAEEEESNRRRCSSEKRTQSFAGEPEFSLACLSEIPGPPQPCRPSPPIPSRQARANTPPGQAPEPR